MMQNPVSAPSESRLAWWRGPSWLTADAICFDTTTAERYDAAQLDQQVLFDLAGVRTARDAAAFVTQYGPLDLQPGDIAVIPLPAFLGVAARAHGELWGYYDLLPGVHTAATQTTMSAPPGTLMDLLVHWLDALTTLRLPLHLCVNCGRFFLPTHHNARYCRAACQQTAASRRNRLKDRGRLPVDKPAGAVLRF